MAEIQARDDKGRFISKSVLTATGDSAPVVAAIERLQATLNKQLALTQKALGKSSKSAGAGSAGVGVAIPSFLSATAIGLATKALVSFNNQLARTRDAMRSLSSNKSVQSIFGRSRDMETATGFLNQKFSNRFASDQELAGVKNIQDQLSKTLGTEGARALTLQLTESLKDNQAQLTEFLATASTDLPTALESFASADIQAFSQALTAVTMETDELTGSARNMEALWHEISDLFEDVGKIVAPILSDVASKIRENIGEGTTFRNTVLDLGEKAALGVVKLISWIDDMRLGWLNAKLAVNEWALASIIAIDTVTGAFGDDYIQALAATNAEVMQELAKLSKGSNDRIAEVQRYFDGLKKTQDALATSTDSAVNAAKRQRDGLEKLGFTAQQVAAALERLEREHSINDLISQRDESRLSFLESTPFGFARAYSARQDVIDGINRQLANTVEQLKEIRRIENLTDKDRKRALELEREGYDLLRAKAEATKQLAKGYLDAIQAQAFGAGHFEKIIVSADQALGVALRKGIAKKNPLLGSLEPRRIQPFRFGLDPMANQAGLQRYAEQLAKAHEDIRTLGDHDIIEQLISIRDAMGGRPTLAKPAPQRDAELQRGTNRKRASNTSGVSADASILEQAGRLLIRFSREYEAPEEMESARHPALGGHTL